MVEFIIGEDETSDVDADVMHFSDTGGYLW